MKYDRNNINKTADFLLFYGHKLSVDGSITESCLSQWWPSRFVVDGLEYKTAEHWMMAQKALLFRDDIIHKKNTSK